MEAVEFRYAFKHSDEDDEFGKEIRNVIKSKDMIEERTLCAEFLEFATSMGMNEDLIFEFFQN